MAASIWVSMRPSPKPACDPFAIARELTAKDIREASNFADIAIYRPGNDPSRTPDTVRCALPASSLSVPCENTDFFGRLRYMDMAKRDHAEVDGPIFANHLVDAIVFRRKRPHSCVEEIVTFFVGSTQIIGHDQSEITDVAIHAEEIC